MLTKQRTMSTPAAEMGTVPPGPPERIPVVKFYGQNPGPLQATAAQMVAQNLQAATMELQLLRPEVHRRVKQWLHLNWLSPHRNLRVYRQPLFVEDLGMPMPVGHGRWLCRASMARAVFGLSALGASELGTHSLLSG